MHTGRAIDGKVTNVYIEGGIAASNQVPLSPQVMAFGQISAALVVPVSWPAVISPIRLVAANALDLINEAIGIRSSDRTDATDAAAIIERGVQSNDLGDEFWDGFKERIELAGGLRFENIGPKKGFY